MRTTLNLDDDIVRVAKSMASAEGKSLGEVVSGLARRGLRPERPIRQQGFPTFDVSPDEAPITLEMVNEALDDWP